MGIQTIALQNCESMAEKLPSANAIQFAKCVCQGTLALALKTAGCPSTVYQSSISKCEECSTLPNYSSSMCDVSDTPCNKAKALAVPAKTTCEMALKNVPQANLKKTGDCACSGTYALALKAAQCPESEFLSDINKCKACKGMSSFNIGKVCEGDASALTSSATQFSFVL